MGKSINNTKIMSFWPKFEMSTPKEYLGITFEQWERSEIVRARMWTNFELPKHFERSTGIRASWNVYFALCKRHFRESMRTLICTGEQHKTTHTWHEQFHSSILCRRECGDSAWCFMGTNTQLSSGMVVAAPASSFNLNPWSPPTVQMATSQCRSKIQEPLQLVSYSVVPQLVYSRKKR